MKNLATCIRRFLRAEDGATAIEYALIAAGIGSVIVVAVNALGVSVLGKWTSVKDGLGG